MHSVGGLSCHLQELEETELTLVASAATLAEMCTHLEGCREIAVDLEHHSYRSFLGITCLMQVWLSDAPACVRLGLPQLQ